MESHGKVITLFIMCDVKNHSKSLLAESSIINANYIYCANKSIEMKASEELHFLISFDNMHPWLVCFLYFPG